MLLVAWILLVTRWRFLKKPRRRLMSPRLLSIGRVLAMVLIRSRRPDCCTASRPEITGAGLDFGHCQLDLAGLQMTDVDLGIDLQLLQLFRQQARAQVLRDLGKPPLRVRESGFDQQVAKIRYPIDHRPESGVDRRVAGKNQTGGTRVELIANGWHRVFAQAAP
jgi:hypothetical protein